MTDDTGIAQAREALSKIQLFWNLEPGDIEITRLGGLTNLVFRVDQGGEQYVLRLPGQGTCVVSKGRDELATRFE